MKRVAGFVWKDCLLVNGHWAKKEESYEELSVVNDLEVERESIHFYEKAFNV